MRRRVGPWAGRAATAGQSRSAGPRGGAAPPGRIAPGQAAQVRDPACFPVCRASRFAKCASEPLDECARGPLPRLVTYHV
jgi:hypothetical protein